MALLGWLVGRGHFYLGWCCFVVFLGLVPVGFVRGGLAWVVFFLTGAGLAGLLIAYSAPESAYARFRLEWEDVEERVRSGEGDGGRGVVNEILRVGGLLLLGWGAVWTILGGAGGEVGGGGAAAAGLVLLVVRHWRAGRERLAGGVADGEGPSAR